MNEGVVTKTKGFEKLQVECEIERFRVVTYNIHKCRGLDRRVRPARIAKVLGELNADLIALQEVLSVEGKGPEDNQARFIADELGLDYRLGVSRKLNGGAYGNVILSRLPLVSIYNYDLSHQGLEPRGCLRADVKLGRNRVLHVYNVHLGTSYLERRHQARGLFDTTILRNGDFTGPRIILGDFNEWTRELASRLLSEHFDSVDVRSYLGWPRTYPGVLPFLRLDHYLFRYIPDAGGGNPLPQPQGTDRLRSLTDGCGFPPRQHFLLSNSATSSRSRHPMKSKGLLKFPSL